MPTYEDFEFEDGDEAAIALAKAENDTWGSIHINDLKQRIKTHHLLVQRNQCCYCKRSLHGEFRMVIDIEHILPKSVYGEYTFSKVNLTVACKRCNMEIKKARLDFLVDEHSARKEPGDTQLFRFIHPNVDAYFDHIERSVVEKNDKRLVKYIILHDSPKGNYTYDFFKLDQLEINSFDKAQGAETPPEEASGIQQQIDLLKKDYE